MPSAIRGGTRRGEGEQKSPRIEILDEMRDPVVELHRDPSAPGIDETRKISGHVDDQRGTREAAPRGLVGEQARGTV